MIVYFKKSFDKQYIKLSSENRKKVDNAILILQKNPFDEQLKNHALAGKAKGKRSMFAGFDLRIIFEVEGNYVVVIMLNVGTHSQLY